MRTAQHYIDGHWVDLGAGAAHGESINPATGEPAARFAAGSPADADAAIAAARRAFDQTDWRRSPRLRSDVLLRFADQLAAHTDEIADWLVILNGKLRREALGEIAAGVSELRYYAGLARNLAGRVLEVEPGCYASLEREAAGVAVIILPWNAPITLLVRSLAPALAAGCTAVIKPAFQTALAHNLALQCLTTDERVPAGAVNSVIEAGSAVSQQLCASPDVDVISFTGSTAVGKRIAATAAGTLKRLSLELGGKAPALVFDDIDLDRAVAGIVSGSLILAGQQCTAISRVLVQGSIYDAFADRLAAAYRAVRVGRGDDPQAQMGSLIDVANRDRIAGLMEQAGSIGRVLVQGRIPGGDLARGAFLSPSLVAIEDLQSDYIQRELFGPLLVMERFDTEEQALHRANATRYSLASSVWSGDALRIRRVAARMRFGTVWANTHNKLFAEAETGGHADSGYGRLHGQEGLNDFLETKHFYWETRA
ncbi:aldehyde dehydrogenase family protein [Bordetella sp. BOR01]|uniref:aldehyde dehydrogenase family protein n=1 Tax=Bordetella sp. BOR01 TaxID=2854779 RepID=UPI001C483D2B|nr:aldehyde dehydrogenase family protein [Bordetella sp. BOR01]MBV7484424.1 aldehyde dehydrogenase family protein [Bordetella sp. BOR01]